MVKWLRQATNEYAPRPSSPPVQDRRKREYRRKGNASVKTEYGREPLRDIREVKRRDWNENVFSRPNRIRENAEAAISCREPRPPRRKSYTSSREEEEKRAQMCPCGQANERRTYIVGDCEMYKEERDVVEEKRKIDECDMEKSSALDNSEKTVAILGGKWRPQKAKQEGIRS